MLDVNLTWYIFVRLGFRMLMKYLGGAVQLGEELLVHTLCAQLPQLLLARCAGLDHLDACQACVPRKFHSPNKQSVCVQVAPSLKYDHVLIALMDDNPYLSDGSKQVQEACTTRSAPTPMSVPLGIYAILAGEITWRGLCCESCRHSTIHAGLGHHSQPCLHKQE